jgi:hypothetical protein
VCRLAALILVFRFNIFSANDKEEQISNPNREFLPPKNFIERKEGEKKNNVMAITLLSKTSNLDSCNEIVL